MELKEEEDEKKVGISFSRNSYRRSDTLRNFYCDPVLLMKSPMR